MISEETLLVKSDVTAVGFLAAASWSSMSAACNCLIVLAKLSQTAEGLGRTFRGWFKAAWAMSMLTS